VVRDLEPGRLRADEDVLGRADARLVLERPHRDVHTLSLAHDREQQRPTRATARVIPHVVTPHEQVVRPLRDLELLALHAREGLERRARAGAAPRAMAVRRVQELVGHAVRRRAAFTLTGEHLRHYASLCEYDGS